MKLLELNFISVISVISESFVLKVDYYKCFIDFKDFSESDCSHGVKTKKSILFTVFEKLFFLSFLTLKDLEI